MNHREAAKRDKLAMDERVDRLETELMLTKSSLAKELDYRRDIEHRNGRLLAEQRDLMSRCIAGCTAPQLMEIVHLRDFDYRLLY